MNESRFDDLSEEERDWIDAFLDGTIDAASFAALQDRMLERPALRKMMRGCLSLRHDLHELADVHAAPTDAWLEEERQPANTIPLPGTTWMRQFMPIATAASLAFVSGLTLMHFHRDRVVVETAARPVLESMPEPSASGFAVIGNLFDAEWGPDDVARREGDSLGTEVFRLRAGVAEIQFYSGATMVVRGPAEIVLKSAWEATCHDGIVRMRVPPAARGFKLHGPSTEIVDLGTEFGFEVRNGKAHVEVLDGEIVMRHRGAGEQLVERGGAWRLPNDGEAAEVETGMVAFPELGSYDIQARFRLRNDFERWRVHSAAFARDPRVIAYYTFERTNPTAVIASLAEPRSSEFDGAVVLAETAEGRWPGVKQALEFRRPGSRVRVRIPGEFNAFTFTAWVRIDSLDRRYNALFMADGYETGEPHWQIRDDGKLMLSVMIDDRRPTKYRNDAAGFHHVYFSPRIWDQSMSGRWMQITSVFDPPNRRVSHYVNGRRISNEPITDENLIATLGIGNGEIGNWGEPFRETPWFAIRNLNGRIDELAILNSALTDGEVKTLHEQSRATHH